MKKILILGVLAVLPAAVATATAKTAGELLGECRLAIASMEKGKAQNEIANRGDLGLQAGVCFGFIDAAMESMETLNYLRSLQTNSSGSPPFCTPKGVSVGQAIRVVVKYLEEHPEGHHEQAFTRAWMAMTAAWPCPAADKGGD